MDCNKNIYLLLEQMTKEQQIQFALSCVNRVLNIYEKFLNTDDAQSLKCNASIDVIYPKLLSMIDYIRQNSSYDKQQLNQNIKFLESCLTDDEDDGSSVLLAVAGYVVTGIIALLEFVKEENFERLLWCSDCLIEILNQLKFEEFYSIHSDYSDDAIEKLVDTSLDNEVNIQAEIIKYIQNNEIDKLHLCIDKNKISIPPIIIN